MNNITKYNLKTSAVSVLGLVLLLSVLSYLAAPETDGFMWNSVNPIECLRGFVFALGFGLGVPVWLAVIVIAGLLFVAFVAFLWMARKVVK